MLKWVRVILMVAESIEWAWLYSLPHRSLPFLSFSQTLSQNKFKKWEIKGI